METLEEGNDVLYEFTENSSWIDARVKLVRIVSRNKTVEILFSSFVDTRFSTNFFAPSFLQEITVTKRNSSVSSFYFYIRGSETLVSFFFSFDINNTATKESNVF